VSAAGGRRWSSAWPALLSVLLHGGTVLALAALHRPDRLPDPLREQGAEIVWQESAEDTVPGEEAAASPSGAAEAPTEPKQGQAEPHEPPQPEQVRAEPPEPPRPEQVQAEPPEPPRPEPPPPEPALAEVAEPDAEPPPPDAVAALPLPEPPPAPVEPPPAPDRPPDPPAARTAAPANPTPRRPPRQQQQHAPSQAAAPAAAARQAPPGPAAPPPQAPMVGSRAVGAVSPPGPLDGVRNPEPEYPQVHRQRGDEGFVTVLLGISESGTVMEVEVVNSSGHPAMAESVRRVAPRWRFRPAMRDGVPVAGSLRATFHFRLR
jgi:periplasmic protein TonB